MLDVHTQHDALAAEGLGAPHNDIRVPHRRRIDADFLSSRQQHLAHILQRPHAAADRKWDKDGFGHPPDDIDHDTAPLMRRGDVIEDDLVSPRLVVESGHRHGVADIHIVLEPNPFGGAPVADIQARDDAFAQHGYS